MTTNLSLLKVCVFVIKIFFFIFSVIFFENDFLLQKHKKERKRAKNGEKDPENRKKHGQNEGKKRTQTNTKTQKTCYAGKDKITLKMAKSARNSQKTYHFQLFLKNLHFLLDFCPNKKQKVCNYIM